MQILYVQSGIRRPFTPIDQAVIRALKQLNYQVLPVLPGKEMQRQMHTAIKLHTFDCILVHMAWRLTKNNWDVLQKAKAIPKLVWFTDDPYYLDWSQRVGSYFDFVFTNEVRAIPVYRNQGCKHVYHLPLGVDPSQYYPLDRIGAKYSSDVLVLGTAFHNRRKFMQHLLPYIRDQKVHLIGPGWDQLPIKQSLLIRVRSQWVSVKEANAYYNGARIVLNLHRSPNDEYLKLNKDRVQAATPNNRTFEASASGAFQLVEARKGIFDLYPSSAQIPVFHSLEECVNLLKYYLCQKRERSLLAQAMHQHTLSSHLFIHRLTDMFNKCKMAF